MDKPPICETDIIRCLSDYNKHLADIRERIQKQYMEIATTDELLKTIQLQGINYDKLYIQSGYNKKDLTDILIKHEKEEREYALYLKDYIFQLMQQEESLKRIWICYQCLANEQRQILTELYVHKKAWKVVKMELKMSHSSVSNYRNAAIENIIKLYNSDLSNLQIARYSIQDKETSTSQKEKDDNQISLFDYMEYL